MKRPGLVQQVTRVLPGAPGKDVCRNTIAHLCVGGWKAWKRVCGYFQNNKDPHHHLGGQKGSNANHAMGHKPMLEEFFDWMAVLVSPQATPAARTRVGETVQNDNREE